ncbi:MAG: hypothetical protein K2P44_04555 [Lachnospiraceae bacterium]|nr:hypothetical protein [Lachnospiraceae bacterium]
MKIGELLGILSLPEFRHVSVRRGNSASDVYIGGGAPMGVSKRFGSMDIKSCDIRENVLIIYVTEN